MKAAEGKIGRVFVLRLEDGDMVPGCIERFAAEKGVQVGFALLVGGVGSGEVVVGPEVSSARPAKPMFRGVSDAHEVAAVGVLAPDAQGRPVLHIHGSLGRAGATVSGCFRKGLKTWVTGEVILYEVTGTPAVRLDDPVAGFALLEPLGALASATRPAPTPPPAGRAAAPEPIPATTAQGDGKRSRAIYLFNAEVH